MSNTSPFKSVFAASLILLLGACASTNKDDLDEFNDPWESMNRATYGFNKAVDQAVFRPVVSAYKTVIPKHPRKEISNLMRNLREPWVFVNDILQLKFKRAGITLGRFVVNTTVGLGGLFNPSDDIGIPYHSEDFGQTLATWGIGEGPYIVLPFFGPSNGRDAVGLGAFIFADPTFIAIGKTNVSGLNLTRTGVDALDIRTRLDGIVNGTFQDPDGYELMRSAYRQSRKFEIHDGNPPTEDDDLFDDFDDEDYEDGDDEGGNAATDTGENKPVAEVKNEKKPKVQ
ncbi:MAG: VacJ family lipoprotein [Kordiimonadaceae bacterium]|nr:VacJ family lipoprotein [Kordiimonadaceae bacterium]